MLCDDPQVGWRWGGPEASEGGGICVLRAISRYCMAETNTTLESSYPPIKISYKNRNYTTKESISPL